MSARVLCYSTNTMKAKQIVERLEDDNYSKEVITWLVRHFAKNLTELREKRNVQTDEGLVGIFRDQYQKWKAVSKRTEGKIKQDGYWQCVEMIADKKIADFAKSKVL